MARYVFMEPLLAYSQRIHDTEHFVFNRWLDVMLQPFGGAGSTVLADRFDIEHIIALLPVNPDEWGFFDTKIRRSIVNE